MAAPLKNIIVVSVTMKGGIRRRVTHTPLKAPTSPPTTKKDKMPAGTAMIGLALAERPAIHRDDGRPHHARHRKDGSGREIDPGHDEHEGLADGDDEQRHGRGQDVPPRVEGEDLRHDRGHHDHVEHGDQKNEILREEQRQPPGPRLAGGAPGLARRACRHAGRAHAISSRSLGLSLRRGSSSRPCSPTSCPAPPAGSPR